MVFRHAAHKRNFRVGLDGFIPFVPRGSLSDIHILIFEKNSTSLFRQSRCSRRTDVDDDVRLRMSRCGILMRRRMCVCLLTSIRRNVVDGIVWFSVNMFLLWDGRMRSIPAMHFLSLPEIRFSLVPEIRFSLVPEMRPTRRIRSLGGVVDRVLVESHSRIGGT